MCMISLMLTYRDHTPTMALAETRLGRPLREALLGDFRAMTTAEICERLDIAPRTLERWMARLGLERRTVIVEVHDSDGTPGDLARVENNDGPDPLTLASDEMGVEAQGG